MERVTATVVPCDTSGWGSSARGGACDTTSGRGSVGRRASSASLDAALWVGSKFVSWRWYVFHVVPVLAAVAISIEVWFLADKRELQQAQEAFAAVCGNILLSVRLSWDLTVSESRFLTAFFFARGEATAREFQRLTYLNRYYNTRKTIFEAEYVPMIADAARADFEASAQAWQPGFRIWDFDVSGAPVRAANHSRAAYMPIAYDQGAEGPNAFILGLDLLQDPVEGPVLKAAAASGEPRTTAPFLLKGMPAGTDNRMGGGSYWPIYRTSAGDLSLARTDAFVGIVVSVVHYPPMMQNILQNMQLQHLDVFLMHLDPARSNYSSYVAHFEGPPAATQPGLRWSAAQYLRPDDITGDFVTPFTADWDVPMLDRTFRLIVRARQGAYANGFRTRLPVVLLCISLLVKVLNEALLFIEHHFCAQQTRGGAEVHHAAAGAASSA